MLLRLINGIFLRPFKMQLTLQRSGKPWDGHFQRWIRQAERDKVDPNDIGDGEWEQDRLDDFFENWYEAEIRPVHNVLELGPGTGRLTRRIVGKVNHLYVADYSQYVCVWMQKYLVGKGAFTVIDLTKNKLDGIPDHTLDAILAHGVFEHLGIYAIYEYLKDFSRLLKLGGRVVFSYDDLSGSGGRTWLAETKDRYGNMSPFFFYTADMLKCLADTAGFSVDASYADEHRIGVMRLRLSDAQNEHDEPS